LEDEEEEVAAVNGIGGGKPKPAVRRGQLLAANTNEVNEKIREAIRNATSLEEIERLNQMLRAGQIPQTVISQPIATAAGGGDEQEMEQS